ncbi:BlaI/MecI/CopY family transcriptional regulator [Dyadobacter arcticus]|uniref:Transcriptional regulator n=1 Tax=Dyadobacter arcticus TaxID=1078754 RepID=A0ABX0UP24_9BACT|nr:BlaI/MecI/CopY family transcriptional regulator [Dyadobacter arcticus]NIJ53879.1 putative transcriptional regulator [Dyadobacter arcticus]
MEKLSAQEEEAMLAIWKTGEGSIKTFMAAMSPPGPPYTTLASTVKNLEKKGYILGRLIGNVYLYSPAVTEEAYKQKFIGNVVKDYFENSYQSLVSFFVEKNNISTDELKEIIRLIESKK